MKTLVIGLGNPILGDDGVGWKVAEEVEKRLAGGGWQMADGNTPSAISHQLSATSHQPSAIEVDCLSLGGLSLMERLTGYERVILVDSMFTGKKPIGSVITFALDSLPDLTAGHSASAHDTSLRNALNVGRSMNLPLPTDDQVQVVAIEAQNVYDFSQELTPAVAAALPQAVDAVLDLLRTTV
jgi:hydrogenase maturation protease